LPWEKPPGKITVLGTKSVYKGKYLSQRWILVLKGTSDKIHPLFKGLLKHSCHYIPKFSKQNNLENCWAQSVGSVTARVTGYTMHPKQREALIPG
jgi:hypothetical protein